jgi:hypothetical protein
MNKKDTSLVRDPISIEVSVPLPTAAEPKVRKVEIQEPAKATKAAA